MKDAFKNILYVTDLADSATKALRYAVDLAEKYQSQVTILHVIPDFEDIFSHIIGTMFAKYFKDEIDDISNNEHKAAKEELQSRILKMSAEAREELGHSPIDDDHVIIEEGDAEEIILKVTTEKDFQLIIMGSHHYSKVDKFLLGSVAEEIFEKCKIPVLMIPLDE